jgi:hypothetical protein
LPRVAVNEDCGVVGGDNAKIIEANNNGDITSLFEEQLVLLALIVFLVEGEITHGQQVLPDITGMLI